MKVLWSHSPVRESGESEEIFEQKSIAVNSERSEG